MASQRIRPEQTRNGSVQQDKQRLPEGPSTSEQRKCIPKKGGGTPSGGMEEIVEPVRPEAA